MTSNGPRLPADDEEGCGDCEALLHPYADGELDGREKVELEAHLGRCESCRAAVESVRAFRLQVRSAALAPGPRNSPAPPGLRRSILDGIAREHRTQSGRRLFRAALLPASLAAAAAAAAFLLVWDQEQRQADQLVSASVAHHQRDLPLEVQNADLPGVQSFFRGKVDFPPARIPAFRSVDLIGARLSNLSDRQAAYVTYGASPGQRRVSLFVFDAAGLRIPTARRVNDQDVLLANQHGYNVALWKNREIAYSLVSDMDERDILELVAATGR